MVFIAVMSVALVSFSMSITTQNEDRQKALEDFSNQMESLINERMSVYKESLRSGVGLFNATERVTKKMWQQYVSSSTLFARYPGVQGLGYIYLIEADDLAASTDTIKQEIGSSFELYPAGVRDAYSTVVYLEPLNDYNQQAIGFDMYTSEQRKEAMILARDTGNIQISDAVHLVQENDEDKQLGIFMFAPQYADGANPENVQERRENIRGYVYAYFKSHDLFSEVFSPIEDSTIEYRIVDPTNPQLSLFESSNYQEVAAQEGVRYEDNIKLDGVEWEVDLTFINGQVLTENILSRPRNILFSGIIGSFLIAGIVLLLLNSKSKQLIIEKERGIVKAKDSLLSIASHQLRTPATGVKQYIGLLLQGFVGELSPQQTDILEKAYDGNERQLKTINDILYLAKIDSGRIVLAKKKVNLNNMVRSIIDEMAGELHAKNHNYTVKIPKRAVCVDADEHMLRMVIENLISNAIKYTKSGGEISVSLKNSRYQATISVKDNGVGISKNSIDKKLFKEFSRIPNELTKSVTGTGIGLYLAKNLTELHGGKIEVESELGKGSEFFVVIPKSVKNLTIDKKR